MSDDLGALVDAYADGRIGADELLWTLEVAPVPVEPEPSRGVYRALGRI